MKYIINSEDESEARAISLCDIELKGVGIGYSAIFISERERG